MSYILFHFANVNEICNYRLIKKGDVMIMLCTDHEILMKKQSSK